MSPRSQVECRVCGRDARVAQRVWGGQTAWSPTWGAGGTWCIDRAKTTGADATAALHTANDQRGGYESL